MAHINNERKEFRAVLDVDPETKGVWKRIYTNPYSYVVGVGLPVSLGFVVIVIGTQIAFRLFYLYLTDNESAEVNFFFKNLPYLCYAISIIVYSKIFNYVAKILVDKENHRTEQNYEASLI
jgi:ABC-type sugar transport system permease subunit